MRVRTYLRERRHALGLSIRDVSAATGLAKGEISMLERGHTLPRADQAERMVRIYGPREWWYPAGVLHSLDDDLDERICPGCEKPLEPDASRARRYHNDRCRSRARRARPGSATVV